MSSETAGPLPSRGPHRVWYAPTRRGIRSSLVAARRIFNWPGARASVVFAAAYFVAYHFSMGLAGLMPSPLWFPDSVLLCALLLSPRSAWWFYLACAFPLRVFASVPSGAPWWFLIACYVNDSVKALLSAILIQRFCGRKLRFGTLRQFLDYSLIAVIFVPLLSGIAGGASRYVLGDDFFSASRAWFLGDALAGLVLTPVILCFADAGWQLLRASPNRYWEAGLLIAGMAGSGYLAFMRYHSNAPFLLYLPVPFLLWAAVRFGPFGVSCSLSGISALSIFGIFQGQGPFGGLSFSSSVLSLQLFLAVISFSLLALATVIRQQKAGEAALRISEERLHQLNARLIHAQENERKRIGQELHEDVAQRVAALSIGLSALAQDPCSMERLTAESSRLRQDAAEIVHDVSRLSRQLRPPALETVGLAAALRTLCEQLNDSSATSLVYTQFGETPVLSWDVAVCLYRVAQESVNNSLRHSGATRIYVCLCFEDGARELRVSDNGKGFELDSAAAQGVGLAAMAERMRSVGGKLVLRSTPGRGTEVIALAPALARAVHA